MPSSNLPDFLSSRTFELPNALIVQSMAQRLPEDVETTTTVIIKSAPKHGKVRFGDIWLPHDLVVSVARERAEIFMAPFDRLSEITMISSPVLWAGAGQLIVPAYHAWIALCPPDTVLTCVNSGVPGHHDKWGEEAQLQTRQD